MEIFTTKGMIEESLLEKRCHTEEWADGWADIEIWSLDGEIVKQSTFIRMKQGLITGLITGSLGEPKQAVKDFVNSEYQPMLNGLAERTNAAYQEMLQAFTQRIADTIHVKYPELAGLELSFKLPGVNVPGFKLEIKPRPEPTEQGGK